MQAVGVSHFIVHARKEDYAILNRFVKECYWCLRCVETSVLYNAFDAYAVLERMNPRSSAFAGVNSITFRAAPMLIDEP